MLYNLIFFKKPLKDGLFAMPRKLVFVLIFFKSSFLEDFSFSFCLFSLECNYIKPHRVI